MARLDGVVEMLRERRRPVPQPQDFVQTQEPDRMAEVDNPYLRQMIDMMDRGYLSPRDVKEGMVMIAQGLVALDGQMQELAASVDRRVDSLDPAIQAIQEVAMKLDALIQTISSIEIPTPPAPEVSIDMSKVEMALGEIQKVLDEFEPASEEKAEEMSEPAESKPKKWKFDIKRNAGGYIRSIEAVEEE